MATIDSTLVVILSEAKDLQSPSSCRKGID